MKLRRAVATAVAAAAIAPAALLAAPAAFAAESAASAAPSPAVSTSVSVAPSTSDAPTASDAPSSTPTSSAPSTAPSSSSGTGGGSQSVTCQAPSGNFNALLNITINGLPGKIPAGSGWHQFTMTLSNPTSSDIKNVTLGAGISPVDGADFYKTDQVKLQAWDPDAKQWFDVADGGDSVGPLGGGDLPAGASVDTMLRLEVAPTAPIGAGFTFGIAMYPDAQNPQLCDVIGYAEFDMQIVAANKPGGGTPVPVKPPKGAKPPVPKNPPANGGTNHIIPVSDTTGSKNLATTGASSTTPIIAGIGGAAVVLGAGAMFVVRRKKSGSAA